MVVTSELRVICLDHNLKQLWTDELKVSAGSVCVFGERGATVDRGDEAEG